MKESLNVTIEDILKRDSFSSAKVIGGERGLHKKIKWTHILETRDFETLINGEELILTTGMGINLDQDGGLPYIEKLIQRKAAGICIELGTNIQSLSPEIIQLADDHQFPVIVFEETVKFIDITQDLHTLIINKHHQQLNQLTTFGDTFNKFSLTPSGILKILQALYTNFRKNVFLLTDENTPYYYPPDLIYKNKSILDTLRDRLKDRNLEEKVIKVDSSFYAVLSVKGLGQTWGYLCVQTDNPHPDDFLFSVMDRAALSIAQIFLRNKTIAERKQSAEDEIVQNLLEGKSYDRSDFQSLFPSPRSNMYFRVFLIKTNIPERNIDENEWEEIKLQRAVIVRSVLKQFGFFPSLSIKKDEIAIIASFIAEEHFKEETERFTQVIDHFQSRTDNENFQPDRYYFGVSKVYQDLADSSPGYQEAKETLILQDSNITNSFFYEDTGVYRLLFLLPHNRKIDTYIMDHLGPLITYDHETNSELLRTMTVYLECNGAKKETAEKLYIVRQTLYHRLNKISELLGDDFMGPENRLAFEVAVKAYNFKKIRG
ncbi:PucR family transcriptional regulator [Lentibacillus sediminis]|uniref:PucR family transcriptional regulator n=1 Tax=Lentibacillus sediminis TaxID=1940529 RepID=UPI000C1BAD89|nr:PucR family transcriptional regulator [Lentibacillus sediminis]